MEGLNTITERIMQNSGTPCEPMDNFIEANGDYFVDEPDGKRILYCGLCKTPKQKQANLGKKGFRTFMVRCKCEDEKWRAEHADKIAEAERQKAKDAEDGKWAKIISLKKEAFPDERMYGWTFEKDDGLNKTLTKYAKGYARHFEEFEAENTGMLLYGDVGTGKTFTAACIINYIIEEYQRPCLLTSFSRICNQIWDLKEGKQTFIDGLNKFALLVIDDLGVERESQYMAEIVHNIIDTRYRAGRPIVVTTNLTGEQFKNPTNMDAKRIYSRLYEMCHPIEVKGIDRRAKQLANRMNRFKEIIEKDEDIPWR